MSSSQKPLRICLCTPNPVAYSETFIRNHIEHLPAEVVLYGGWPVWEYGAQRVIAFPWRAGLWAGSRLNPNLTRFFHQRSVQSMARFVKRHADVVLAEYGDTAESLVEVCQAARIPLVAHFHGYDAHQRDTLAQCNQYRRLFRAAAALIVVSRWMQRQLAELGAPLDKLHYCPYGVDTERFLPGNPAASAAVFVAVGRFVAKKAPHLTLLAFQRVLEKQPDARLEMVGDGPLLDPCKQMAQALGIWQAVRFHGRQSSQEVAAILAKARAFVQHSVVAGNGDSEGTPVAVLEAGACGLPVVATRHAGIPDVVLEGETGLLVDELDIEGMASHMLRLARDPALAQTLGQAARHRIASHFSLRQNLEQLRHILLQAVQNNRHGKTK